MNSTLATNSKETIDRIYHEWNDALSNLDVEGLLALYAPDATLESPLVPHLLKTERGICHGHEELRKLLVELRRTQPKVRQFHRTGYFTDGHTLMWEYPREAPNGEQMDFVEVMEIENGLIQRHRVYWGWYGVGVLKRDEHHKKKA